MKREAFLRELNMMSKKMNVDFEIKKGRGKGSHCRVKFNNKQTTIQDGELNPYQVARIKKQLGIK